MVESNAMNLHIDKAGRIVLPKAIRQQLGITPDSPLELVPSADGVLLRRTADKPMMRQIDGVWVHQGTSTATADADWSNIVDSTREERATGVWPA
jgi:AbrB family looped-hinge helix DNA binding protein